MLNILLSFKLIMKSAQTSISKWHLKADYVETCNCDFGCPCNFNGFPTNGFCRALTLYHIQVGNYGDVKLDNLDVVTAFSWLRLYMKVTELFSYSLQGIQMSSNAILSSLSFRVKPRETVHSSYLHLL